jgi:parallel beta-helix repeat protein
MRRIGKLSSIFLCLLMLVMTFTVTVPVKVIAEEPLVPDIPGMEGEGEWWIEGIGTYFELTNSDYLDITLTSSETIYVYLESNSNMVSFIIESECTASSIQITLSGFEGSKTYYRYQDGYLQEAFTTDGTGSYSYSQDISIAHHVYFQEETSTLYISSDYTFSGDIYDSIVVTADDIVIDGNDFTLQGSGTGYGIYLNGRRGVTITNVVVNGFYRGVYFYNCVNCTVIGNSISSKTGIQLQVSAENILSGNVFSGPGYYAMNIHKSWNNVMSGNIVNGYVQGVAQDFGEGNIITSNTFATSNAGISLFSQNTGISVSGNIITGGDYGIGLSNLESTTLSGNTIIGCWTGIRLVFAYGNTLFHNNFIDNSNQLSRYKSTNTWDNGAGEGNYWSDYPGVDDGSGGRVAGDGIGDTNLPYHGVDMYPLMNKWSPDPLDAIEGLKQYIWDLEDLNNGNKNSLISQLDAVENALSNGHKDTAINILTAFINHIEALGKSGKMTPEQIDYITSNVQRTIVLIES